MISLLIEGKLHSDPVRRTSARGVSYLTAQMRVAGDDIGTAWCSLIAIDAGAVENVGTWGAGDMVAVAGHASLSTWQPAERRSEMNAPPTP